MENKKRTALEKIYGEFVTGIRGRLYWQWDGGVDAALAAFSIKEKDAVHGLLVGFLPNIWRRSTVNDSDKVTRQIANQFGGLKEAQRLFTADTKQDGFLYALWWPWDNGDRISIRVAPSYINLSKVDYLELIKLFKALIGIAA